MGFRDWSEYSWTALHLEETLGFGQPLRPPAGQAGPQAGPAASHLRDLHSALQAVVFQLDGHVIPFELDQILGKAP
ncbi:uncharacterized protein N7482_003151 [Penicillium canariense]|uniref:Uncharacterized protein n=1 Tax=Penicillium canariense TaxID=189055 RepID=A0A9W9LVI0_9EURO|nr:uncharacterized protein N7482_003151 [Penicillium canariense]KAJ5177274.1 hypothetical protein N7482_003151 [Penicillium canariense]